MMESQDLTTIKLNEDERIDDLERSGYKIIQNPKLFCFGIDAVLLSGFCEVRANERALDICSGNGIIPILLKAKTKGKEFVGLELQDESSQLFSRSIELNGISDSVKAVQGDLRNIEEYFLRCDFDVVTCNPPYMIENHGIKNPDSPKAIARHELTMSFEDAVRAAAYALKPTGRFYLVHRPFRLVEIFETLTKYKLEPKRMKLVHPYIDHEPNMVLIEAVMNGKRRLTVEKPLVVYESEHKYTQEIYDIYGY